ncbi:hypothetical protein NMQ03_09450 [Arthrobacter sp. DNA4]|uniref:hypothetical protein n=1 Tax=Arthrobacter sp. DNA4 TaxID=2963432 RepID=UPI0020CDF25C|nr:hypothetical protein [Arthrobacter sp. DNA4]UTT71279.1 hypothetical protein NMQ03_09450 [Arthrobacter sp. DNA4]
MNAVGFPLWTWRSGDAGALVAARHAGEEWVASGCKADIPTRAVGQGDVVFVGASADLDPARTGPRAYIAADFLGAALAAARAGAGAGAVADAWAGAAVSPADPAMDADSVRHRLGRTPWGALTLLTGRRSPGTPESTAALVHALLDAWDALDGLTYVDADVRAVPFEEVVALSLGGLLGTWLPRAGASLRDDLATASATLRAADETERRDHAVARMAELAASSSRIVHRNELTDRARLAALYDDCDADERAALATGDNRAILPLLYGADRYL